MTRIRNWKEFSFGCFLMAVGALGLWMAADLHLGNLRRMGPGWMPNVQCLIMIGLGALLALRGTLAGSAPREGLPLRALFFVFSAVVFFALTIGPLGALTSVFGTVLLAAAADRESRPVQTVLLAALLSALAALIFVKGLGLGVRLLPAGVF